MEYKKSQYCVFIDKIESNAVIYNTLTGGISEIENWLADILFSDNTLDENIPYFNDLLREKYIVPVRMNEYLALRYNDIIMQNSLNGIESLTFVIAPTTACNLSCKYCFEHEKTAKEKPSKDTIDAIAEFIAQQCNKIQHIKKVNITWFGGEPLLCYDEIIDMGKAIKTKLEALGVVLESTIITNGVLLTLERLNCLKWFCGLSSVQITIDGLIDEYCRKKQCDPYIYHCLIDNIKSIQPHIKLCIRLNADKGNLAELYKLADYFYGTLGFKDNFKLYFAMLRDYSEGKSQDIHYFTLVEYQEEKKKFYKYLFEKGYISNDGKSQITIPFHKPIYCNLSRCCNFAIGPKGELYKCEHHFGQADKIVGDVVTGLYYNDYYFKHMYETKDDLCEKCSLYPICQTNCMEIRNLVKVDNGKCMRFSQVFQRIKSAVSDYLLNK